jgi:hypothetical protein
MNRNRKLLVALVVVVGLAVFVGGYPWLPTLVAAGASYLMFRMGFAVIGTFARPVPEPPPPGELRKVKIQFRCTLCGTEVRMTMANDEMPEPPRHCMEDMEFVAPVME